MHSVCCKIAPSLPVRKECSFSEIMLTVLLRKSTLIGSQDSSSHSTKSVIKIIHDIRNNSLAHMMVGEIIKTSTRQDVLFNTTCKMIESCRQGKQLLSFRPLTVPDIFSFFLNLYPDRPVCSEPIQMTISAFKRLYATNVIDVFKT